MVHAIALGAPLRKKSLKHATISYSQIMTYLGCPEHWLFRYYLGIKSPPAKAIMQGRAVHDTLAYHYGKKKEGDILPVSELQDYYAEQLNSAMKDYENETEETKSLITKEYLAKEKETTKEEMLDAGTAGIAAYKKEVDPRVSPDLIETSFAIATNQDIKITGRIDLTDTKRIIHETKTKRRAPAMQEVARDPQLAMYRTGYENLTGKEPAGYSKDFIILGKREAKIQRYQIKKPDIDSESLLRYLWNILKAIEADSWYCLHQSESWICSKDWDGYWLLHKELRKIGFEKMLQKYGQKK